MLTVALSALFYTGMECYAGAEWSVHARGLGIVLVLSADLGPTLFDSGERLRWNAHFYRSYGLGRWLVRLEFTLYNVHIRIYMR